MPVSCEEVKRITVVTNVSVPVGFQVTGLDFNQGLCDYIQGQNDIIKTTGNASLFYSFSSSSALFCTFMDKTVMMFS